MERNLGRCKSGEWGSHSIVPPDEPSAEVGKPQESLQLLPGVENGPGGNGRDLGGVHLHVVLTDDVPQEREGSGVKLTLLP